MINFIKQIYRDIFLLLNITINRNYYYNNVKSQNFNQESKFLEKISKYVTNKYFVEIGFHYNQFNCINLIKKNFNGLLIDAGSFKNFFLMKVVLFLLKKKIKVIKQYVALTNINNILLKKNIGVLSIDIDGNDFWILKKILENKVLPEIIIIEYNSSFLNKSIGTEYKEEFDRFNFHVSGFYHGASLSAFCKLSFKYGYHLVKVMGGINAIFVNKKIYNNAKLKKFMPRQIIEHNYIRAKISKLTPQEQFKKIKHLKFIKI
jgi:hypothetical protein